MSIKTKKWSEQSERVRVKTTFAFVKVKHKVKKWLSLVTFMFNGENNTGLQYMNVVCVRGFSYYREIHTKHPPPGTFGPILIRGGGFKALWNFDNRGIRFKYPPPPPG